MKYLIHIILVLAIILQITSCDKLNNKNAKNAILDVDNGKIVITSEDVQPMYNQFKFYAMLSRQTISPKDSINLVKGIAEQLAIQKILVQKYKGKKGYTVSDSIIQENINKISENIKRANKGTLESFLKEQNQTLADLKRDIEENILFRIIIDSIKSKINIDSNEIVQYFNKNLKKNEKKYNLVSIVVPHSKDSAKEIEAKKKIENIYKQLKNGADFKKLAYNNNEDFSAKDSGKIGWVTLNNIDPQISKEVQNLKIGQYTNIISTFYGYNIVKLYGVKDDSTKLESKLYKTIEEKLKNKKIGAELEKAKEGHTFKFLI